MAPDFFLHIANSVKKHDRFLMQRRNCARDRGQNTTHKVISTLRMMPYGIPAGLIDDHLAMSESTFIHCVKKFAMAVVVVFGPSI